MNPNPGPPPAKKTSSTQVVLIVLGVLGGLAALCCLGTSIVFYRASQSPDGKKVFSALGKTVKMAQKGLNAPGTAELRKAGCPQAMVVSMADALELAEVFVDAGTKAHSLDAETIVVCQGGVFDTLPTDCDALAETYVSAVHPKDPFTLSIRKQGDQTPVCQKHYGFNGIPLGGASGN